MQQGPAVVSERGTSVLFTWQRIRGDNVNANGQITQHIGEVDGLICLHILCQSVSELLDALLNGFFVDRHPRLREEFRRHFASGLVELQTCYRSDGSASLYRVCWRQSTGSRSIHYCLMRTALGLLFSGGMT